MEQVQEILTPDGFRKFEGILDQGVSESLFQIDFHDGSSIKATGDHEFLLDDGETYYSVEMLSVDDVLYPSKHIISITQIDDENVYDLYEVNENHCYFSNGVVSHNCNIIYLDEFAFVERAEEFYTSTYPVISSGKSTKVIITSTANGIGNPFYYLWEKAIQNTFEETEHVFKPFRVDWWDVPGRDEKWKSETINNTSERQFDQEFSNNFLSTGKTLIEGQALLKMSAREPLDTHRAGTLNIYDTIKPNHNYIMCVDTAKGRGQDYSAFTIIDITGDTLRMAAVFRDNKISPLIFPNVIKKYATAWNNAFVVIESNDIGALVAHQLYYDLEYEHIYVSSVVKANAIGVEMNKKIKRIGCSNLKDLIEEDRLLIPDKQTIRELSTFEEKGQSFEATEGNHDDLVMTLVIFGWFSSIPFFTEMHDKSIKTMMFSEKLRTIEDDMVPVGVLSVSGVSSSLEDETLDGNTALNPYKEYETIGENLWEIVQNH